MANLKDLIVNGASRFIGKIFINDSSIGVINGSTVGNNPKFTDTTSLTSMTGTLPIANGGTGGTTASAARTNLGITPSNIGAVATSAIIDIAHGGTGSSTAAAARTALGLGSAAVATTSASVGNNTNLPTGAAIQTYVTGLGYEANQNAFSTVKVGTTDLAADSKTDTLTITAGNNITLTPTASSDSFSIAATNTTYAVATTSADGLMSKTDKQKLNNLGNSFGTVTNGVDFIQADGVGSTLQLIGGNNVTLTGDLSNNRFTIAATNTTYSSKTAAQNGTDVSLVTTGEKYTWNQKTSNAGTVTSIATGTGLTGGPVTSSGTISHQAGIGTAGTVGPSATSSGQTVAIPYAKYDSMGHITAKGTYNHTVNSLPASAISSGTFSTARLPVSTSVGNNNNLPTGAAIQSYVTGLGYEANQNAFSNVIIGSSTVAADSKTDSLTLVGSGSVSLTADTTNDKITISGTNTTYAVATTAANGLMSANDKQNLNGSYKTIALYKSTDTDVPYWLMPGSQAGGVFRFGEGDNITFGTKALGSTTIYTINASGGGGSSSNRVTLFTGDSTGNVTLSSSAANYDLLEIFYEGYNGVSPQSMKILNPNGRAINLNVVEVAGGDGMRIRVARYTISGTSITSDSSWSGYYTFNSSGSFASALGTNVIHITRVDGIIDSIIDTGMGDKY